jgi:hypothetical protein
VDDDATFTALIVIAAELAEHARVTLATRKPVKVSAQRPFGCDRHFWLDRTGLEEWAAARGDTPRTRSGLLRVMATTNPTDKLAVISTYVPEQRGLMRSTSYVDVAEATVHSLFEDCPEVRQTLLADLGFSAADVIAVLQSCHDIQIATLNSRMRAMFGSVDIAMNSTTETGPDPVLRYAAQEQFSAMWEPAIETVTAGIEEIAAATGQPADRVSAIVGQFRLDLGTSTPTEVVDDFMFGRNPLRTHPVLAHDSGRIMPPHSALIRGAIKENFEEHLKSSSVWETYRKHRGDLLASRTRAALEKVLPGASHRGGTERFEYFIPAIPKEQAAGDPAKYTKRVEGDHLCLLDDVAIIVEDKANALSAVTWRRRSHPTDERDHGTLDPQLPP